MPDDTRRIRPEDPKRINLNQQWEVLYWCSRLGCSETELRQAVNSVGPMVEDVKKWLGNH